MLNSKNAKGIVSAFAAVLAVAATVLSDNVVTAQEFVTLAIAAITAVTVYVVPNMDGQYTRHLKTILAFAGAALAALSVVLIEATDVIDPSITHPITATQWITVILAGLGAIGVAVVNDNTDVAAGDIQEGSPPQDVEYLF